MTSGLVNASFSLPKGQAVKMIFFAPCMITEPIGLHSVLLPSQQVTTTFTKYKFKEDR